VYGIRISTEATGVLQDIERVQREGAEARRARMKLIIPGRPITKKNHQQIFINRATGARFITQSPQYKKYEAEAILSLKAQKCPKFESKVSLRCLYYLESKRGFPDLVGLIQATQDILQKANILSDDKNVIGLDGSRIVGIDKENPRVEIEIKEVNYVN
jgi:Holliday junction resolvase RusA-like endonuclease